MFDSSEDKQSEEEEEHPILREFLVTALQILSVVTILVLIPYLISGIWPPYVSVVSGSMEPNIDKGDMILVVENHRYSENDSVNGIQTAAKAGNKQFNREGDVILYYPNGDRQETPIIHRAITHADEGENWVRDVDKEYLPADSCERVNNCPAQHDGFITLGDNNEAYDQSGGISSPVKTEWVYSKAQYRIPYLGWIRIFLSSMI